MKIVAHMGPGRAEDQNTASALARIDISLTAIDDFTANRGLEGMEGAPLRPRQDLALAACGRKSRKDHGRRLLSGSSNRRCGDCLDDKVVARGCARNIRLSIATRLDHARNRSVTADDRHEPTAARFRVIAVLHGTCETSRAADMAMVSRQRPPASSQLRDSIQALRSRFRRQPALQIGPSRAWAWRIRTTSAEPPATPSRHKSTPKLMRARETATTPVRAESRWASGNRLLAGAIFLPNADSAGAARSAKKPCEHPTDSVALIAPGRGPMWAHAGVRSRVITQKALRSSGRGIEAGPVRRPARQAANPRPGPRRSSTGDDHHPGNRAAKSVTEDRIGPYGGRVQACRFSSNRNSHAEGA